jgi:pimeloyl-[acyl-carrier protein] methyl ester esterase
LSKKNSSSILCLSGWGQNHNSLEVIFRELFFDPFFISSFDYSVCESTESFFTTIAAKNLNPEILVGWSLGGQLALRLVEKKIIKPKLLILIAPPFQMVKDERIQVAMAQKTFADFYQNFVQAPNKTLKQFAILTAMNDRNSSEIARNLNVTETNISQLKFWLEELKRFSCFNLDFSEMPRTLFFQGAGDMIVHPTQAEYFQARIKNLRLEIFKNCGHAPHLSDLEKMQKVIIEEIAKLKLV